MDEHWRNTMKPARFFMFDARCVAAILIFMMHIRLWTLILGIISMGGFYVCERLGLTFESALRALRCYILGRDRPANHRRAIRRWIEYTE